MRTYALIVIVLSDLILYLTKDTSLNPTSLNFLLTIIIVVLVSFIASALLRNFKTLKMTRNYTYSGGLGVLLGILFYFWVKDKSQSVFEWFESYGMLVLLIINLTAAIYIFLRPKKKKKTSVEVEA